MYRGCDRIRLPPTFLGTPLLDVEGAGRVAGAAAREGVRRPREAPRILVAGSVPELPQAERDRIEWPDAHRFVVLCARNEQPLPVVQLEGLEGAVHRVDEP